MPLFSTSFVAPDGTLLPAFNPVFANVQGGLVINTNAACGTGTDPLVDMVRVSLPFPAAQFVEGVVDRLGGTSYTGLAIRCGAPGSGNGYYWIGTPGISYFGYLVAGVFNNLATPGAFAASDLIRIEADINFELFINGVSIGTIIDSTYSSGVIGIAGFRNDLASGMRSLRGGDLHPAGGLYMPAFVGGF
jgi:hypothetical protein